jgi:hypothetical protein
MNKAIFITLIVAILGFLQAQAHWGWGGYRGWGWGGYRGYGYGYGYPYYGYGYGYSYPYYGYGYYGIYNEDDSTAMIDDHHEEISTDTLQPVSE